MRAPSVVWLWEWEERDLSESYYEGKSIIFSKWLAVGGRGGGRVKDDWGFKHNA